MSESFWPNAAKDVQEWMSAIQAEIDIPEPVMCPDCGDVEMWVVSEPFSVRGKDYVWLRRSCCSHERLKLERHVV